MKWLFIAITVIPLAGCVTSEKGAQPMTLGSATSDKSDCFRFGFAPDTPAFGDCRVTPTKND